MNNLKKIAACIIAAGMLITSAVPTFAFTLDPTYWVTTGENKENAASLEKAFENAKSGDVIEQDKNLAEYEQTAPITVKTDVTLKTGKGFNDTENTIYYKGTGEPLFIIENSGKLTLSDCTVCGNVNAENKKGGLILVKSGGTLVIDGATLKGACLKADGSLGGVIYAEKGGKVVINSATFKNNYSANGLDIYAEDKADVTVLGGISVDFASAEGKVSDRANSEIAVTLNGKEIAFDVKPQILNGRTMVPMRKIFEALGATVEWDGDTQSITSVKGDITIKMTIGDSTMYKNSEAITLDVPPQIVDSRTLVPVRAIAESFGITVDWTGETQTVVLTK